MIYNMSYNRAGALGTGFGVIPGEDMLGDDEVSHKQKEGITVNCSRIAVILSAGPPRHALRDEG